MLNMFKIKNLFYKYRKRMYFCIVNDINRTQDINH